MTTQVSIRTNPELLGQFNAMAEATGRTRSYLINQAMEEYIAREAWQIAEIRKGLEEADAGGFVPDAEMQAFWGRWAK
jgi:predicted transcriptional regulator